MNEAQRKAAHAILDRRSGAVSPEEARRRLVNLDIWTTDGKLSPSYGGETEQRKQFRSRALSAEADAGSAVAKRSRP